MNKYLKRVIFLALLSRISIILLQFLLNTLITDHISDGFISPAINIPRSVFDEFIFWIFGGFLRWDAHYFINIAIYGYVYENTLAFFPGFPLCIRAGGAVLWSILHEYLNIISIYLISSVIVNVIVFVLTARSLFYLTCKTLKDQKLAFFAASLFTINPASIFFTAPYSEALFSFFTFQVMLHDDIRISCLYVALSSIVRSNGIVNLGFPIYRMLKKFVNDPITCRSTVVIMFKIFFIFFNSLSLFILYQIYSYRSFCTLYPYRFDDDIVKLADTNSLILRGRNVTNMCQTWLPYMYVQNHYWDIGFLHYFKLKQLPNFILALPIMYLCIVHCTKYFIQNLHLIPTLGMKNSAKENVRVNFFPYGVHLISLIVICLFFVHIQVSTRLFCSSSPAVYWFSALLLKSKQQTFRFNIFGFSFTFRPVPFYFLSYCIIGTALFSNFYPWT